MPAVRSAALLLASCVAVAACGDAPRATSPVDAADTHFTVRGRWPDVGRVTWRVEAREGPLARPLVERAVARACAAWTATGAVNLVQVAADADADVTIGWRRGHHGACEPFGIDKTVAHSGPVAPGTFVHLDADREWVAEAPDGGGDAAGYTVYGTALHELGHVLGLGHSAAADAVMRTGVVRAAPLSPSDLYGLQSLYGGGDDAPGDVVIRAADGAPSAALRGVAPAGRSGVACFDVDGDGACEVLVWRTDRAGNGVLMAYHFDDGPRLARTTGPYYGMASYAEGAANGVMLGAGGERLFVTTFPNGRVVARRFDEHGLLVPHRGEVAREAADAALAAQPLRGDLDGDGAVEQVGQLR